ncbi:MAG: metallophosphoesterase [Clostridia bacterium]|nr:metallophosphoesterase [Clostridia bacterium]
MERIKISGDIPFFWQWDMDRRVSLWEVTGSCTVHFVQEGNEAGCLTVEPYVENGQLLAAVPNILLQTAAPITAYLYHTGEAGRTIDRVVLHVEPREKPADYVYTETEVRTWETLAQAISTVSTVPTYIRTEGERVAQTVLAHQGKETFSLAFLSDMHCGYKHPINGTYVVDDTAIQEAGQALKVITETCPLDAVVFGGDFSDGSYATTREMALAHIDECTRSMRECAASVPMLYLNGNHDNAPYMATADRVTAKELLARIGRKNRLSGAVMGEGCYGYRDFESQKMRVIFLDTDDKADWESTQVGVGGTNNYLDAGNLSAAQLNFLANQALDLSDKPSPAEWGILIFSHRSLDTANVTYTDETSGRTYTGSVENAMWVLVDYLYKNSNVYSHNGVEVSYDFSTLTETATVYGCIHGHDHALTYTLLDDILHSIGCPNVLDGRERASEDGNTYVKTAGTAESTAFCVITVDRAECKLYADHYGAGYDREWLFTPFAVDGPYTNRLPLAVDTDGSVYDGKGYREGYRLDSGGNAIAYDGFTVTGFIPVKAGDTVYLKNVTFNSAVDNATNQRLALYDADKVLIGAMTNATSTEIMGRVYDENHDLIQFTVEAWGDNDVAACAYFRMNGTYIGEDSIITVNQPIV